MEFSRKICSLLHHLTCLKNVWVTDANHLQCSKVFISNKQWDDDSTFKPINFRFKFLFGIKSENFLDYLIIIRKARRNYGIESIQNQQSNIEGAENRTIHSWEGRLNRPQAPDKVDFGRTLRVHIQNSGLRERGRPRTLPWGREASLFLCQAGWQLISGWTFW